MLAFYILVGMIVLIICLFLFLIAPNRKRDCGEFANVLYAHRGLHTEDGEAPENSLASFVRAREAGFGVELDIQLTADKQVVVFHDSDLKRMCGVEKRVDELTYEELTAYTLQGGKEKIPLLSDALEALDGAPLLCEVKSYGANNDMTLCEAAWPMLKTYKGALSIESFNPLMVRWFRNNHPEVVRGILSMNYASRSEVSYWLGIALGSLLTNFLIRPDFIAYDYNHKNSFALRLCNFLFRPIMVTWTITDIESQQDALTVFDTCIFEQYLPENASPR